MSEYKPYIDENGRLYLFSLCDGTPIFLQQLIVSLERLGCTAGLQGHQAQPKDIDGGDARREAVDELPV